MLEDIDMKFPVMIQFFILDPKNKNTLKNPVKVAKKV